MECVKKFEPVHFRCSEKIGRRLEQWDGIITQFINHGSHYEVHIESRSGFIFLIGKYICGGFISIPAYKVGSDLSDYGDYFWNNERLSSMMSKVDAASVAEALRTLKTQKYI